MSSTVLYYDEVSGRTLSSNTLRVWAFMFIPSTASEVEARGWLISQGPRMSKSVRDIVCRLHLQDSILAEWRAAGLSGEASESDQSFEDWATTVLPREDRC